LSDPKSCACRHHVSDFSAGRLILRIVRQKNVVHKKRAVKSPNQLFSDFSIKTEDAGEDGQLVKGEL
jgi:hypothetical protein